MENQSFDSGIVFENSFAEQLEGMYVYGLGDKAPNPEIVKLNDDLALSIGVDAQFLQRNTSQEHLLAQMLSGGTQINGAQSHAQAYAGHQFGGFNPQLGDGRALLLGETITKDNQRVDIQLKGSGRTVFSRTGDGKATIGHVIREYLLSEAMHSLGVPTTRALAMVSTGETVRREKPLPGAVLTRIGSSFLRVGSFQFLSARDDLDAVQKLADYAIERHYPEVMNAENRYLSFIEAVCVKQASLVAKWMSLGFVHGVMNTDNMTICGETIDYGPCAFIDVFDPKSVFSSVDRQGRYAYQNQPTITLWNIARLAETLLPFISAEEQEAVELATQVLQTFDQAYEAQWLALMRSKFGLDNEEEEDVLLINEFLILLTEQKVDFTQAFRALIQIAQGNTVVSRSLFQDANSYYIWQMKWQQRLSRNDNPGFSAVDLMESVSPIYVPRNHKVEEAITAAQEQGDFEPFEKLLALVTNPFTKREGCEAYEIAAPEHLGQYVTYCGT